MISLYFCIDAEYSKQKNHYYDKKNLSLQYYIIFMGALQDFVRPKIKSNSFEIKEKSLTKRKLISIPTDITVISLKKCQFESELFQELVEWSITRLQMDQCSIKMTSSNPICCKISQEVQAKKIGEIKLKELHLSNSSVDDSSLCLLLKVTQLSILNLSSNLLTSRAIRHLSRLRCLEHLDLFDNIIGDEGARYLSTLTSLTVLCVARNQIGNQGAIWIGRMTRVTALRVWGNQIGDDGARSLGNMRQLKELGLVGNPVTKAVTNRTHRRLSSKL